MMFRSVTNRPKSKKEFAPAGNPIKEEFRLVTEPDGNTRLEKTGEINTNDLIQSFRDECNIHNIVNRALNGDPAALQVKEGIYFDITGLPKDIHEAYAAMRNAENIYCSLSNEKRLEYGNFENFLKRIAQEGCIVQETKFEEVKPDETVNAG